MHLSYAVIAARRDPLSAADAVALVLAALRQWRQRNGCDTSLPSAERLVLNSGGSVSLLEARDDERSRAGDDEVRWFSDLLHGFLVREDDSQRAAHPVPGALLLLVARARREIDLPPPTHAEFERVLSRFGSPDILTLAQLYRRLTDDRAAHDRSPREPQAPIPIAQRARPVLARRRPPLTERRVNGPGAAELRRALRETERQLFNVLHSRRPQPRRYAAAAAVVLLLVATGALVFRPAPGEVSRTGITSARRVPPPPAATTTAVAPVQPTAPRTSPRTVSQYRSIAHPLLTASVVGSDIFSPSFGPDANELLFHAGRVRGALMRATFDQPGRPMVATLLRDGAANYHGTRSPDGRLLAYDSDRAGTRAVYVAQADGRAPRIVSGDGYAAAPRWSPDGRTLAFIKADARRPRVWNVWVLDVRTDALTQASHHRVGQAWGPSWFPDSRRIAYSVEDRLVVKDLATGRSRALHSPLPGRLVRTPAVSPDGQRIVLQVHRDGVWILDLQTQVFHRVLADQTAEEFAWAPDAHNVVFHTRRRGAWSLWQMEVRPAAAG